MERREFSVAAAAGLLGLAGVPSAWGQDSRFQEGKHYLKLDKEVAVEAPAGKIEVVEFFWYNCPHCNAFEPRLEEWIKRLPKDVVVRRTPVAFRADFVPQQKLFYALEALGKLEEMHRRVFYAIHVEKVVLNSDAAIATWAEKQGLDKAKFIEQYNSFGVATKARRAAQTQDGFQVQGVPALGIAGRFYTDGSLAGSMDRALQVADTLVAGIRRANPAK
ncbi:MAG TPA: thiol:disulfide interchange protein DsbA/DsbL [Burkholderiaceae bacterium]